jgi:hypothetical protein
LVQLAARAEQERSALDAENDNHDRAIAALDSALERYRNFFTRVTTADDDNIVPIVYAARLQQLLPAGRQVLRVYVDEASGSLLRIQNIGTMLGADPLRVSGGSVISFLVTDPRTGQVQTAGVLTCTSALATLRQVQSGRWRPRRSSDARYRQLAANRQIGPERHCRRTD